MMTIRKWLFFLALIASFPLLAADPQVEFRTSYGNFVIELYPDKAPVTVANFLKYANSGFYENTLFHRVIDRFIVQGGGFTPGMKQKNTEPPIPNEANNGLRNEPGTVAMARRFEPDSAAAEFFINLAENRHLDYHGPDAAHIGYCVFGRVIQGMDIVEKIARAPTHGVGKFDEMPRQDIVIEKTVMLETPIALAQHGKKPDTPSPGKIITPPKKGKKRG